MNKDFKKVAILGGGLLGGSLALAIVKRSGNQAVALWARREETVVAARAMGVPGATASLAEAVAGADLIVLAVPVGAMSGLIDQALEAGLAADALVTDVGSVKGMVHASIAPGLRAKGIGFIGSHPMAGSEQGGIEMARTDLFDGAACLLTNDEEVSELFCQRLEHFWSSVGCRVHWMLSEAHDQLVARISHLPHVIASAGAIVALESPEDGCFGGGGLRDTTRVAGGDPGMWSEILHENRAALVGPLQATIAELREMLASLEAGDQETIRQWLLTAKNRRDTLSFNR